MMPFYLEKSLGLDIRDDSVAVTLLGKKLRSMDILGGAYLPVAPLQVGDESSEKQFLEEVNRFLMKMNLWPENVVVSLPRHHYSFQSFELPAPDRKAVDSMVEFEMERHFSFGLEGLLYGWHVSSKGEKNYHIISAALKKETAEEYLDLVRRLGIPTTILDVPTFADANLILWNDKTCRSLEAIVDLGTQALEIILVKNRSVEFSCNLPLNDPDFKNAYLRDDLSPDYHESMAIGMAKLIVEELQEALASCRNIDDSEAVERIHFLGGGPYAPYVARQLEKETEVVTLLVPIPEPVSSPPPETYSTAFMATSLGLAMRDMKPAEIEVNLLPREAKPKKKKVNLKSVVTLSVAVAVLLIAVLVNKIVYNNVTLNGLNRQLEEIKAQTGGLEKIDLEYRSLTHYVDALNTLRETHPPKLPVLLELSRVLPRDTWLSAIQISKNQLEIRGYSASASKLVPGMERSKRFGDVQFDGTIVKQKEGERFAIKAEILGGA